MPNFPDEDRRLYVIAIAVASFADDRPTHHADLGDLTPLDWLINEAAQHFIYFPKPLQLRRLYETRFAPLDGRSTADLESEVAE